MSFSGKTCKKRWRIFPGIFLITCLSVSWSCGGGKPETGGAAALESLSVSDITITYPDYYPISYTVQPASLKGAVTVRYSLVNPAHTSFIELFDSDHAGHPNSVRAKSGTAGSYTVTASAAGSRGTSKSASFTVTVQAEEIPTPPEPPDPPDPPDPPETTKSTTERGGQTIAQLASDFDATASTCSVQPIDNITTFSQAYLDDYIRGVDMGSIIEVEAAGGKFYDNDRYRVGDVFELLSYYGINWVRIRLWNDPYTATGQPYGGGTNDYAKAVQIARRAKKWGMKVLLDFHYSDFWAHPGQQSVPKAWKDFTSADQLAGWLKAYTKQVLSNMYADGAMPDMVQVGNEINTGVCGFKENGNTRANEKKLLSAGLAAVREISAEYGYPIKTVLHATDGMSTVDWYFGVMQNLDFDILGLSSYPMWHGDYTAFKNGLQNLANKYKKPIVVLEYSVSYTSQAGSPNGSNMYGNSNADVRTYLNSGETDRTIQGQASVIRNMNNAIMNNTVSGGVRYGIGAFWWEPAWLPLNGTAWAFPASSEWYQMGLPGSDSGAVNNPGGSPRVTWANQAFFSFTGTALPSLNAFLQMMGKPPRPAS